MPTSRRIPALVALGLIAVGCSSSNTASGNTDYDDLRARASTDVGAEGEPCPVDLDTALDAAGIRGAEGAIGGAEASPAMPARTDVDPNTSTPIDIPARAAGVVVTCTAAVNGDEIRLFLLAADDESAPLTALAQLQSDADLSAATVQRIADTLDQTAAGEPIELADRDDPERARTISFAVTEVDGAGSAAMIISAPAATDASTTNELAAHLDDIFH